MRCWCMNVSVSFFVQKWYNFHFWCKLDSIPADNIPGLLSLFSKPALRCAAYEIYYKVFIFGNASHNNIPPGRVREFMHFSMPENVARKEKDSILMSRMLNIFRFECGYLSDFMSIWVWFDISLCIFFDVVSKKFVNFKNFVFIKGICDGETKQNFINSMCCL